VYINVYDILPLNYNQRLGKIGMAIFHTGIEINGSEYAYGGNALLDSTGVYEMRPRKHEVF
jgi:deubiquitinase DESI2